MATRSTPQIRTRTFGFQNFQGLDTSRDITALDTGNEQHLCRLENATCDWRGQIVRDASAIRLPNSQRLVIHTSFYTPELTAWAEETGAGIDIRSEGGAFIENAYPKGSIIASTVYNRASHFVSAGQPAYILNAEAFEPNLSPSLNLDLRPAFVTSVGRRMAIAGIASKPTEVQLCRVDNPQVFADDENPSEESVLRAGRIDVGNALGTADKITGIGSFEQSRLAIFTSDRVLLYRVGEDIDEWEIDDNANIQVGCISHNTIQRAGTDLLFCSRAGITSVRRSRENGILAHSYSLSNKVDELYRRLVKRVCDHQRISAVWDQDTSQYHIFFPCSKSNQTMRLTLSMNPEGELEGEAPQNKFSRGSFLNARCGTALGGRLIFGTAGGQYQMLREEDEATPEGVTPEAIIEFPWLWHGSINDTKATHSIIVQASGRATVLVEGINENGDVFGSTVFEVDDIADDNKFADMPLFRQYERQWQHRYRAAKYRLTVSGGDGLFRLTGFAVKVRDQ